LVDIPPAFVNTAASARATETLVASEADAKNPNEPDVAILIEPDTASLKEVIEPDTASPKEVIEPDITSPKEVIEPDTPAAVANIPPNCPDPDTIPAGKSSAFIVKVPENPAVPSDVLTKKFFVCIPDDPIVISSLLDAKPAVSFVPWNKSFPCILNPAICPLLADIAPDTIKLLPSNSKLGLSDPPNLNVPSFKLNCDPNDGPKLFDLILPV